MTSYATPNQTFRAGGNIYPCRFLTLGGSSSLDFVVVQSGTGELPIGISINHTRRFDSDYAAVSGDSLAAFGDGQFAQLELGSGGCVAGDKLGPDTNGKGIVVTTADVGAVAYETGAAGDIIKVKVNRYETA